MSNIIDPSQGNEVILFYLDDISLFQKFLGALLIQRHDLNCRGYDLYDMNFWLVVLSYKINYIFFI